MNGTAIVTLFAIPAVGFLLADMPMPGMVCLFLEYVAFGVWYVFGSHGRD